MQQAVLKQEPQLTAPSAAGAERSASAAEPSRMSLLMASNDLDRAQVAFMMGTGAKAMGVDVSMFFALWGVNLLRKAKDQPGCEAAPGQQSSKPNWMQKMMCMMMPAGPQRSGLSKMNFAGMGPWMMKLLMKKTGTSNLAELMEMSVELDIEFIVCSQSMEIMGITRPDIIALPNLTFAGVATFMERAMESKVCLMV